MRQIYFTPGPAELFYTVEGHMKNAFNKQLGSISHRSTEFESIYAYTIDQLKKLLEIPDNFEIFFTSSATEIWERSIQSCVENSSFHLVNGSFSKRFYDIALALGKSPVMLEAEPGSCVDVSSVHIPEETELIGVTQNETSTGASQPLEDIYLLAKKYPKKILTVDIVSAVPYVKIDFEKIDAAYFSVQKGFGLPPGLGVWILNDRCIEKSKQLMDKGISTGSYHSILSFHEKAKKMQTPATPNMLWIYLLGQVANDMNIKGIQQIRRETEYKSALLYYMLNDHPVFSPFVEEEKYRSKTTIVIKSKVNSQQVIQAAAEKGIVIGTGYGKFKHDQIRIANFPTHSKEQFEMLVDFLSEFRAH